MNYVQGSSVSTCFMYDGRPAKTEEHIVWREQAELESRIAAEEAAELEWERDVRYLLLELWEMLDEEAKDAAHSDDGYVGLEHYGERICAEYNRGVEALAQLYRRCKALLP